MKMDDGRNGQVVRRDDRDLDAEVRALLDMPDSSIDTEDIPEVLDFSPERGRLYRPAGSSVAQRQDAGFVE